MTELTIEHIQELIEARKKVYQNVDDAIAAYNREQELSKEYNGRQLLELIQNADDASARQVIIHLDKKQRSLTVYNDGEPFSYEGLKSIMIANLSSKLSSSFIGNKGLGFRSILFWADSISIRTANLQISFSEETALKYTKELCYDLDAIRRNRHLSASCVPFPVLGIPAKPTKTTYQKGCTIEMTYKPAFEHDIEKQIASINAKTLLFLNSITSIQTDGGLLDIRKDHEQAIIDGQTWLLRSLEGELPEEYQDKSKAEKKLYSVKLAIPETDESDSHLLHNYLPTMERLSLPFILHATLELDSSRNRINESKVNQYILGEAACVIGSYAEEILAEKGTCDWRAFRLMTPTADSSSTMIADHLYKPLMQQRERMKIYPSISGRYLGADEYYFYDTKDSRFWQELNVENPLFGRVVRPMDDALQFKVRQRHFDAHLLTEAVNKLSEHAALSLDKRVALINYLIRSSLILDAERLHLLIDDDNHLIQEGTKVFTPALNRTEWKLPDFVRLKFVNKLLYEKLIDAFLPDLFERFADSGNDRARTFRNIIKRVAIVSSNDIDQILQAIVGQTNQAIRQDPDKATDYIRQMVSAIYQGKAFNTILEGVRLIDSEGKVAEASSLFLPTGDNRTVFGPSVDYVQGKEYWGLDCDEREFCDFFRLLGVNRLLTQKRFDDSGNYWFYFMYVQRSHPFPEGDFFTIDTMQRGSKDVPHLEMTALMEKSVKHLDLSRLVLLLCKNQALYEALMRAEHLQFSLRSRRKGHTTPYSFFRYQLSRLACVHEKILSSDVIVSESLDPAMLKTIPLEQISAVLQALCTNLLSLTNERIVDLLNQYEKNDPDGKSVRKIYRLVIDAFSSTKNRSLKDVGGLRLCATDHQGKRAYYDASEVFYSDNTNVPRKLIERLHLHRLYYPSRRGTEKIRSVFGIQSLQDMIQTVDESSIDESTLNKPFAEYVNLLKPYILLYSIQNAEKNKKEYAYKVKGCRIHLVDRCSYQIKDTEQTEELMPYEFINTGNDYYMNVEGAASLTELQNSVEFCNAFAEVFSIAMKLEARNENIVHLFQNFDFMKKYTEEYFPDEDIHECLELLGISTDRPDEEDPDIVDLSRWHEDRFDEVKRLFCRDFITSLWSHLCQKDIEEQRTFIHKQNRYNALRMPKGYEHYSLSQDQYAIILRDCVQAFFNIEIKHYDDYPRNLYTQFVNDENEWPDEQRSLLYFPGHEELIRSMLNQANTEDIPAAKTTEEPIEPKLVMVDSRQVKKGTPTNRYKTGTPRISIHTKKDDKRKEAIGKQAELTVKALLDKEGYQYDWMSGFSDFSGKNDALGYDFFLKSKDGKPIGRYLEVKAFSGHQFVVSHNEYEFAMNHIDSYDVALVDGEKVRMVQSFFRCDIEKQSNGYVIFVEIAD